RASSAAPRERRFDRPLAIRSLASRLVPLPPHEAGLAEEPIDAGGIVVRPVGEQATQGEVSSARALRPDAVVARVTCPPPAELRPVAGAMGALEQLGVVMCGPCG